jgi:flavin reductase (DIM6/NTAB) family NADH-FMN oxidoreductase RutF
MEALINDLVAHNIQNRTVGIIENGSWAATSGNLIRGELEKCKNINILDVKVSLKSSLKDSQISEVDTMADAIIAALPAVAASVPAKSAVDTPPAEINPQTMFKLSYGLFVLTAKDGSKDNGCIINTVSQVTASPIRISITVNKANFTHDMIVKTGEFNVSILSQSVPFDVFKHLGFSSGRDTDKFSKCPYSERTANGIRYVPHNTNGVISAKVTERIDCGTHTLFIADVTEAFTLSDEISVTYQYYFDNIKPKPQPTKENKKGYVCKICGYVYEGDELPKDFVCPLCKHGADDFEKIE